MRSSVLLAAIAAALLVPGCATDADPGQTTADRWAPTVHDAEATVEMIDVAFSPKELRIHPGTKVTFRNAEDMGHTVTPDDSAQWGTTGSGDAPDDWLNEGDSWSWTFEAPGTYSYHCLPHATKAGDGYMGMAGTIVVE